MPLPRPQTWALLGLFLFTLSLTPTAAASVAGDVASAAAGLVESRFERWWNSLPSAAREFLSDPVGFIARLIADAIRSVFALLERAIAIVFYWLGWPFRALYEWVGTAFDRVGAALGRFARAVVDFVFIAPQRVTEELAKSVPALGFLAPLIATTIFLGVAFLLILAVVALARAGAQLATSRFR